MPLEDVRLGREVPLRPDCQVAVVREVHVVFVIVLFLQLLPDVVCSFLLEPGSPELLGCFLVWEYPLLAPLLLFVLLFLDPKLVIAPDDGDH